MKRGEGRDGRLRVGRWLPESDLELRAEAPPMEPVTELIPVADEKPWDVAGMERALNEGVDESDAYKGRRRLRASLKSRFAILAAAVGVAAVAIVVPLLNSSDPGGTDRQIGLPAPSDGALPEPLPNPELTASPGPTGSAGPTVTPTGTAAQATVSGQTPGPNGPVTITTGPGQVPVSPGGPAGLTTAPPTSGPTGGPVALNPTTYEAEDGSLAGSAAVDNNPSCASGSRVVRLIGNWNDPSGPGTLTFSNVTAPADGTYTLTYYSIISDDSQRTVQITVNGGTPITSTAFNGCLSPNAVTVTLTTGANTIVFGNPTAKAPTIDRIVVKSP